MTKCKCTYHKMMHEIGENCCNDCNLPPGKQTKPSGIRDSIGKILMRLNVMHLEEDDYMFNNDQALDALETLYKKEMEHFAKAQCKREVEKRDNDWMNLLKEVKPGWNLMLSKPPKQGKPRLDRGKGEK